MSSISLRPAQRFEYFSWTVVPFKVAAGWDTLMAFIFGLLPQIVWSLSKAKRAKAVQTAKAKFFVRLFAVLRVRQL